ncbi:hypothetical protein A2U01_0086122, partial [Trifolium medium]|nr:hypothetical protein [Trifolium medium]
MRMLCTVLSMSLYGVVFKSFEPSHSGTFESEHEESALCCTMCLVVVLD